MKKLSGRHRSFEPSVVPLSDAVIRERYGRLIEEAYGEFGADPSYLVDMVQSATLVMYRREEAHIRRQLVEEGVSPGQMSAMLAERLESRGLVRPTSSGRIRRKV